MNFPSHASFVSTDGSDLLDAEPLRLSFNGKIDADEMNFILGDAADMDLDLGDFFQIQEEPDCAMDDSMQVQENSTNLNQSIHSSVNSVHSVSCGSIHQGEELQVQPAPSHPQPCEGRSWSCGNFGDRTDASSPHPAAPGDCHFHPVSPVKIPRRASDAPCPRSSRPQRRVTTDATAPDLHQLQVPADRQMYREAVQQLAQSMKRTELSRRQLAMLGVPTLKPRPQPVTFDAQQRLQHRVASGASQTPGQDKPSVMADFFSGRRSTLTDGLEHSRRQLRMYVNRIGSC